MYFIISIATGCDTYNFTAVSSCCTESKPCAEGEGECNEDSDCMGFLRCGEYRCDLEKFPYDAKCCYSKKCEYVRVSP